MRNLSWTPKLYYFNGQLLQSKCVHQCNVFGVLNCEFSFFPHYFYFHSIQMNGSEKRKCNLCTSFISAFIVWPQFGRVSCRVKRALIKDTVQPPWVILSSGVFPHSPVIVFCLIFFFLRDCFEAVSHCLRVCFSPSSLTSKLFRTVCDKINRGGQWLRNWKAVKSLADPVPITLPLWSIDAVCVPSCQHFDHFPPCWATLPVASLHLILSSQDEVL